MKLFKTHRRWHEFFFPRNIGGGMTIQLPTHGEALKLIEEAKRKGESAITKPGHSWTLFACRFCGHRWNGDYRWTGEKK